jgi:hypothetical protein
MLRSLASPEPLRRYLDLKASIKEATAEMKELEPTIYDALTDEDEGTAEAFGFKLEACTSKSYEYSPSVEALEKEVRGLKAKERKDGTAAVSRATGYVRVSEAPAVETVDGLPVEKSTAEAGPLPF